MAGAQMGEGSLWKLRTTAYWLQREDWFTDAPMPSVRGPGECESAAATPADESKAGRMKMPTPQFLEQRKAIILSDLKMKIEAEDWHGVADAAMDLREIEAQAKCIPVAMQAANLCEHEWRYSIMTDQDYCQICQTVRPARHQTIGANPSQSAYLECPQAVGHRGVEGKDGK